MTARPQGVALLPLPDSYMASEFVPNTAVYGANQMQAYARANVNAALASAQAREDELRVALTLEKAGAEHERIRMTCRIERLEEALRNLLQDTQHKNHDCGDDEWCPVIAARAALSTNAATPDGGGELRPDVEACRG